MKKIFTMLLMLLLAALCILTMTACIQSDTGNTCTAGGSTDSEPEVMDPTCAEPAGVLTDKPPVLTVVCGDSSVDALTGGYTWESYDGGDMGSAVIACGAHPLQCKDITPVLAMDSGEMAVLNFGSAPMPGKLTIIAYDISSWDNVDDGYRHVDLAGCEFFIGDGPAIYIINAEWTSSDGYGGKVEYSFCTE